MKPFSAVKDSEICFVSIFFVFMKVLFKKKNQKKSNFSTYYKTELFE